MCNSRYLLLLVALLSSTAAGWSAPTPEQQWSRGQVQLGPNDRLLLREVVVKGARPTIRDPFIAMLKSVLLDAGVPFVATPEEVRRESAQRREERGNPEVQQSTLPPPATIVRETVEVRVTVDFTHEEKDLQALIAPLTRRYPVLGGVGMETKKTTAVVTLQTWDNASQLSDNQLIAVGQEKDVSELLVGVIPVILRQARSEEEKRELRAAADALTKLRTLVSERLVASDKPATGSVLGVDEGFVIIDLGTNNGLQKGAVFSVARVVTHGNIRTALPASATVRVVTVEKNSAAAELVSGDLAAIHAGDRVTALRASSSPVEVK